MCEESALSKQDDEQTARIERARKIGLFRYMLIREAADPALSGRQGYAAQQGAIVNSNQRTIERMIQNGQASPSALRDYQQRMSGRMGAMGLFQRRR